MLNKLIAGRVVLTAKPEHTIPFTELYQEADVHPTGKAGGLVPSHAKPVTELKPDIDVQPAGRVIPDETKLTITLSLEALPFPLLAPQVSWYVVTPAFSLPIQVFSESLRAFGPDHIYPFTSPSSKGEGVSVGMLVCAG